MKKLVYFSLAIATAVGGVFTVTNKTQNAEEVLAQDPWPDASTDWNSFCMSAGTNCVIDDLPTVIISK